MGRNLFVRSKMDSRKTLAYLLPIVHCLASSTNDGRRPAPFPRRRREGGRRGPQVRGDVVCPLVPHAQTSNADALICRPTVPIFVPPDSPRVPLGRGEAQSRVPSMLETSMTGTYVKYPYRELHGSSTLVRAPLRPPKMYQYILTMVAHDTCY